MNYLSTALVAVMLGGVATAASAQSPSPSAMHDSMHSAMAHPKPKASHSAMSHSAMSHSAMSHDAMSHDSMHSAMAHPSPSASK